MERMRYMLCLLLVLVATASAANTTTAAPQPSSSLPSSTTYAPTTGSTTTTTTAATPLHKITDENIHHAVKAWMKDRNATILKFGPIGEWDTSKVTDLSHLFSWERLHSLMNFNSDISAWNTHHVTNMSHIFFGNVGMNLDLHQWNVSRVVDLSGAFANTKQYEGHGLGTWNTHGVVNMSAMFHQALAMNSNHVHSWDTRSLVDASRMFHAAKAYVGNHHWNWKTHNLRDMSEMFAHADNFVGDISDLDVSGVTDMKGAFFKALRFNGGLSKWNTQKVSDMNSMFAYAGAFEGAGLSSWNTASVTNMANMFKRSLFNQALNKWDVQNVVDMRNMFRYDATMTHKVCWKLNQHTTVDGIFFQSHGHFDKSCVKQHFIASSCCRPNLDRACRCGETMVNEEYETEQLNWNSNGNSSTSSSSSHGGNQQQHHNNEQQGEVGAARLKPTFFADKNQYLMAIGIASLCLSLVLTAFAVRRTMRRRGKMTTTTIDCSLDDPEISDLDMNPYPGDAIMTLPSTMSTSSSRGISNGGAAFVDDHIDLGPMEDIPVRGREII